CHLCQFNCFAVGSISAYFGLEEIELDYTKAYLQLIEEISRSPISLLFFIGLYFPLFAFGIWKLREEIAFIKLKDLGGGILTSAFLIVLITFGLNKAQYPPEIQDLYLISLFLDTTLLFIYVTLLFMFFKTESRAYFLIIIAYLVFWFIGDILTMSGIIYMGIPMVFHGLALVSILLGLLYIYQRDIGILTYSELVEEKEKLTEQYKSTKEVQEVMSLLNRILRHDVKNKLQLIVSYIEAYQIKKDESYLEKTLKAVEEVNMYLDKIRDIDRVLSTGSEQLKPINVKKVVEEVLKSYEIPAKIHGSGVALADEVLYSVIDNIVDNAVKHGKTDRIDVHIGVVEGECEIRIVDYGVGMPPEAKKKIFENYGFTLKEKTGLGLYIVKKAVERYGGRVWIEDTKPKGTTFVIRLKLPVKR
ncbi:MAG: HAMP domain-containing histidine kinase, partial [Archaeoglobaceae archaeon]|nr:HAMP domain-containing histidine kinase [Archaeoglobaceae archaeon]